MKNLLKYILGNIVEKDSFEITEEDGEGQKNFTISAKPESMGLIIGKGGRTIKAIQNLLRVKACLEKSSVFLNIQEKTE